VFPALEIRRSFKNAISRFRKIITASDATKVALTKKAITVGNAFSEIFRHHAL